MRLDNAALNLFLDGTIVATLLLAAQGGGAPMREATLILIGAILSTLTYAYGSHVSSHDNEGIASYVAGLARHIAHYWPMFVACLPTVLLLVLAAVFGCHDDRKNPDGSGTVGYTTIGLNIDVVLLFIWGVVAARRGRFSLWWTVLIAFVNGVLGWLIITVELAIR
jgi:hypothetical protein